MAHDASPLSPLSPLSHFTPFKLAYLPDIAEGKGLPPSIQPIHLLKYLVRQRHDPARISWVAPSPLRYNGDMGLSLYIIQHSSSVRLDKAISSGSASDCDQWRDRGNESLIQLDRLPPDLENSRDMENNDINHPHGAHQHQQEQQSWDSFGLQVPQPQNADSPGESSKQRMKRSPHSDPGPSQNVSTSASSFTGPSRSDLDFEQWTLILDTIRANLNLIVSTWGRESRQYDEARGIMVAYLDENLGRIRGVNGLGRTGMHTAGVAGGERDAEMQMNDGPGGAVGSAVERGIEDLMGELRI